MLTMDKVFLGTHNHVPILHASGASKVRPVGEAPTLGQEYILRGEGKETILLNATFGLNDLHALLTYSSDNSEKLIFSPSF